VALGIIPLGSGNGFACNLGLKRQNVIAAVRNFNEGEIVKVDLGESDAGIFISNFGLGFDSHVAHRFAKFRLRGFVSYCNAVAMELLRDYKSQTVKLVINNKEHERKVFMCAVFNSNQYGYHIGPVKRKGLTDGLFDVFVLNEFPRWLIPWYALLILTRRTTGRKHIEIFRTDKLAIKQAGEMKLQYDGEPLTWRDEISLHIKRLTLNVVIPKSK
jgi:diacylglycerol kinase family enzyme